MTSAIALATAVRANKVRASDVLERHLAALAADDNRPVAVTRLLAERARAEARQVDASIADPQVLIDGGATPARRDLGIDTQPISFTGCPALAVPLLPLGRLPLGLQVIGRPGGVRTLFRYAAMLEERGLTGVSSPGGAFQGDYR